MGITVRIGRILCILLITVLTTGYTPEPEPVNKSFVNVFDNKRTRADRHFNNFEYKSAIKLYHKIIKKGKHDDEVILKLAQSYLKINDLENAELWFEKVIHSDRITPQQQIDYAHTLMSNGKYQKAREVIASYEFAQSDYRSKAMINTLEKLEVFYADSVYYQMNTVEDNKPQYSDFSPTVYKNGIVFVSSRHNKGPKFKWDDSPFLDLYYTESDVASAKPFSKTLNSKYHEGPIAFYDNFSKAVLTRSNYLDKELGLTDEGVNNLQLYTATWNESQNDWDNISPVDFSIANYSYGHPTISVDNRKMYFISDMPGGYGGTDIYVSERTETGWGDPVNMGEVINTSGNEMYPFIDDQGDLYFSSNGHGGLGGLDVYQVKLTDGSDIRNMGYPLNTTADDFGFTLTRNAEVAYISSNREGADNIFQIDIKAPDMEVILADNSVNTTTPDLEESLELLATNELSTLSEGYDESELSTINAAIIDTNSDILDNASLKLLVDGEENQTLISDGEGVVSIQVPSDKEYTLIASKEGFEDREITIPAQTLGIEEDLLIVMNSFTDSESTADEVPTTELDPLAVNDDPWSDTAIEQSNKPDINGVALNEVPANDTDGTAGTVSSDVDNFTELDPLAVNDDPWSDNTIDQGNKPDINGVALSEVPVDQTDGTEGNVDNFTELDPLAVNDDPWSDNAIDQGNKPDINGVALSEVPEDGTDGSAGTEAGNVDNFTELDPLAVNDDPWSDNAIDQGNRPDINGVALSNAPEDGTDGTAGTESSNVDNFSELDPLAVNDDPWSDNVIDPSNQPDINGVALSDIPEDGTDGSAGTEEGNVDNFSELDPLAVNDDPWSDDAIDQSNRPDINGVALSETVDDNPSNYRESPANLDPLATNANSLSNSGLQKGSGPAVNGVAVIATPSGNDPSNQIEDSRELDPLAVDGDPRSDNRLEDESVPAINGVAATAPPSGNDPSNQIEDSRELDPLAASNEPWQDKALEQGTRQGINGVALGETEDGDPSNYRDNPTDLDPLASNTDPWTESGLDESTNPSVNGVALTELSSGTDPSNNIEDSEEPNTLSLSDNPWDHNAIEADYDPNIKESAVPSESAINPDPLAADSPEVSSYLATESNDKNESLSYNQRQVAANRDTDPADQVVGESFSTDVMYSPEDPIAGVQNPDVDQQLQNNGLEDSNQFMENQNPQLTDNQEIVSSQEPRSLLASDQTDYNQSREQVNDQQIAEESTTTSGQLVDAIVLDHNSGLKLADADIKLFIDSPNEPTDFEIRDGVLTFDAQPDEDYIIVASHDDYQDQFINISGEDLLSDNTSRLDLPLTKTKLLPNTDKSKNGTSKKFKAVVRDEASNEVLDDAEVKFFVDGKAVESELSKDNGKTEFKPPQGNDYMMLVSRKGYQDLIYHMPGIPEERDIDLSMLKADDHLEPEYRLLAVKDIAVDEKSGADLDDISFKVFEDGTLIETTDDLLTVEVNPDKNYQILATKDGYNQSMIDLSPELMMEQGVVDLEFEMQKKEISESSGSNVNSVSDETAIPVLAKVYDITDENPLEEATILVFADNKVQEQLTSWNSGSVTINAIPGKDYQLVVQRDGYSDRVIPLGVIDEAPTEDVNIALVPDEIKKLQQTDIDLSNASMLVMSGPNGDDQMYLSTEDELYQYTVENDNHYLIKDGEKIMLKERTRSLDSKVKTKQDSDQFNLRSEDQFLYDQLTGDEKAMVDRITNSLGEGKQLIDDPELAVYYNNLPPEYRSMIDRMAQDQIQTAAPGLDHSDLSTSEYFKQALAEHNVSVSGVFNVNNIYYDFDKATIREDAAKELDKLLAIMLNNKHIKVSMFSHTDSRGSNSYNDKLSEKRGISAVNYLVERGISIDRFTTQARGESQLVNSCGDQITCDEDAHQLNRRTEFILTA